MQLSTWAEDHARRMLSPLGRRWRHAEAVAGMARELARSLAPEDAEVLVAAAYLHDVGYAPELVVSGFHPLDGARHLQRAQTRARCWAGGSSHGRAANAK